MNPSRRLTYLSLLLLALASCAHRNRMKGPRLDSELGRKRVTATSGIRTSPILESLDIDELDDPWLSGFQRAVPERSPALRIGGELIQSLELRGEPLGEVLAMLAETADINLVFDPALAQTVDASFRSIRVGDAIHALLEQNDLDLVEDPPGVFAVRSHLAAGGRMRTFALESLSAEVAAVAAQTVAGTQATIVADAAQNLLFVRGSRDEVAAVEAYLAGADKLERQVLIEVQIVEAILDESFEFGSALAIDGSIDGDAFSIAQTLATPNAGAFNAVFDWDSGDLTQALNALQSYVDLELISAPRVMTVSGANAKIEVVEEIPYIDANTQVVSDGGASTTATQQIAFKEAGVSMEVTPTIQANGILKVGISQELSEVVGIFQTVPIIDKRSLQSEFLVADRQTIVLGGLMQDRRSDEESGVPLLKDVPLLGRLFRSNVDATEKRELLIFLTPRIVDPNEAAVLARRYQSHFERKRAEYGFDRGEER